jgi:hypothetical protein
MKKLLIVALATLSLTGVAFAGEGVDPSQFTGVPQGFNSGTTLGMRDQTIAKYFQNQQNQAVQDAQANHNNTSIAYAHAPQSNG